MPKRNSSAREPSDSPNSPASKKQPKKTEITLDSDLSISADHNKIQSLLSQKKTWREVANYFHDYNADSIKKRYKFCRRIIMATFTAEDDERLKAFLEKYEEEKYEKAAKELGKSRVVIRKRIKQLRLAI